ncbi:MAG: flagella basal body P-ring formation protein FlgA [Mycobacteriaceae bacterium]|nr:flagella basal body P-ring formation protein FlgA [Mycobacteriaceae bacterium]
MGESLNPTVLSRITHLLRPDLTRTMLARRVTAAGLVLLAGLATLRSNPEGDHAEVVVANHDLRPGAALTSTDIRIEKRLTTTLPDGSQENLKAVIGATLASPVRRGEVLTDVRLLSNRLAEFAVGPDSRTVPLHLADNALIDLVRPGDVVDVLTASTANAEVAPKVVATNAVVILVSAKQQIQAADNDRVVLVALPARVANAVAGATLGQAVTLTLH